MQAKATISHRTTVALDAARSVAAIYVVLHHVAATRGLTQGVMGVPLRFGQEAVLVFFLLSGFVIFASEHDRVARPLGYYLRRIRRIYPPLIVAIVVSSLVALANGDFLDRFRWSELLGTLANLQDISSLKPGVIVDPYLGNDPLWSLSYEMAFYAIFPFVLRLWYRAPLVTQHLVGICCCGLYVAYSLNPDHFALVGTYFLVWWLGVMVAYAYLSGHRTIFALGWPLAWLALLCVEALLILFWQGYRGLGVYPFLQLRHFAVAILITVALFGPLGRKIANVCVRFGKSFKRAASVSYGLYVLHFPILVNWGGAYTVSGFVLALMLTIGLAYFVEIELPRHIPKAPADRADPSVPRWARPDWRGSPRRVEDIDHSVVDNRALVERAKDLI